MGSRWTILTRGIPFAVILTVFLAFSSIYIPILGLFAPFIWAVPTAVLTAQAGFRQGSLAAFLSFLWLGLTISPVWAAMSALQFAGIGLVLGSNLRKSISSGQVVANTMAVSFLVSGLIFVAPMLMGNPQGSVAAQLHGNTGEILSTLEEMGFLDQVQEQGISQEDVKDSLETAVNWIIRLMPAIFTANAMGTAFVSFLVARVILIKAGTQVSVFPSFRRWYVPWYGAWVAVVGLGLALLGDYVGNDLIMTVGQNIVYVCLPVALTIGLSVAVFWLSKAPTKLFRVFVALAAFFYLPVTIMLLVLVGVFDPLFDFRKIHFKSV